jgi:hypothetical protein
MWHSLIKMLFVLVVLFPVGVSAQTIQLVRSMSFGDQVVGVAATVVLGPTAAGAELLPARFLITQGL